jgi:hypothetical protein
MEGHVEISRVIRKVCPEEETEGNFIKTGVSSSQGAKWSLVVVAMT